MFQDLIFDIGANDGKDSAFYLAKGFHVLAVDADPAMCDKIRQTQAEAIESGRLTVLNIGIGAETATLPFYVNEFAEWSSFKKNSKATKQLSHTVIEVQMQPLSKLIAEHGVPYYLKIDIEGHELGALASLDPTFGLPHLLSFEVNEDWKAIFDLLEGWDYVEFQLVRQGRGNLYPAPVPAREGRSVMQKFTNGHSGCFGRDLPDLWQQGADARPAFDAVLIENHRKRLAGEPADWFDIHARRAPFR